MTTIRLKKHEDRRIRGGHPWIFSNEVDTTATPLKSFTPGQEVLVESHDKRLLGVAYVNPHSLIAARLFSQDPSQHLNTAFLTKRLKSALLFREKLFDKPYYRLVFSEADHLPGLVIDRFGQDLVVQINTAGMELVKSALLEALQSVIPELHSILLRNDSAIRKHEGLPAYVEPLLGTPPDEITLEENDVRFTIPLVSGQKTGWFYDHRLNRGRLKHYVKNETVLDVFSYLGGFGIQAAAFGAKQVTCIETSSSASELILKNASQNEVADKVSVITADAFDAMKELLSQGKSYGVIILDPPAFVKKSKDRKEGLIAYQRINELALKLLSPGGMLMTCSCSMHVSMSDLQDLTLRAATKTQRSVQIIERGHQGPDHPVHIAIPETDYLKTILIRAMDG